jgi:hypothetical protein
MDEAREKVRLWADSHRQAVLYDDAGAILLDVASGKRLKLDWSALARYEEKVHPETGEPYLVLLFDDGTQIALVDPGGVAFAPSTVNSGPAENLPAVVCLRDQIMLKQRVDHYLLDHPDDAPPRECLNLIMISIAILDGARAIGFDVGDLEGALEKSLGEVERRIGSSGGAG